MSNSQTLLDKALVLMNQHLDQIKRDSTYITKDGAKGLTPTDAAVIERYTKLALAMNKTSEDDDMSGLTDAELEDIVKGTQDNVSDSDSET